MLWCRFEENASHHAKAPVPMHLDLILFCIVLLHIACWPGQQTRETASEIMIEKQKQER